MTNTKNLIPVTKRTRQEQIAISRKGGKVSGEARRKKAHLRKTLDELLTMDVSDERLKQKLEEMGLHADNQTLLCVIMLEKAIRVQTSEDDVLEAVKEVYVYNRMNVIGACQRILFVSQSPAYTKLNKWFDTYSDLYFSIIPLSNISTYHELVRN